MASCLTASSYISPITFKAETPLFTPDNPLDPMLSFVNIGIKNISSHPPEMIALIQNKQAEAKRTWSYHKLGVRTVKIVEEVQDIDTSNKLYTFIKHLNSYLGMISFFSPKIVIIKALIDTPLDFIDFAFATTTYRTDIKKFDGDRVNTKITSYSLTYLNKIIKVATKVLMLSVLSAFFMFHGFYLNTISTCIGVATHFLNEEIREAAIREKWS
jgi:hypothetical protein